ncbi:uncharacterized protein [Procambarus clarkii]|uniref:uncharacterized protein isoform X2 n=1 Tax=Procambarus clarkii TaxID=6728 RepID=UPI0037427994
MRMLLSMVVMVVVVVVVVVVESDVPPDSHLYSECAVKKSLEITTFKDSVKFGFVKTSDKDFKITFDQGATNAFTLQYKNLAQHEWLQAELKLSGAPELNVQGRIQRSTGSSYSIGTRKTFTIQDVDILLQCPQGWSNRGLSSYGESDVRIPSSGKNETLVLTPTVDTNVSFSVSGDMRTLCLNNSSGLAVVDEETESDCGDLSSNSPVTLKFLFKDHNVEVQDSEGRHLDNIKYQGVRDLKFLRGGLKGPVYIAQCIGNCTKGTAQTNGEAPTINTTETSEKQPANDPGSYSSEKKPCPSCVVYIVLVVIVAILVLLLSCYVLHLRRQEPEMSDTYAVNHIDHVAGNNTDYCTDPENEVKTAPQDASNTGNVAVETTNDIYVPYDETLQHRVKYLPK